MQTNQLIKSLLLLPFLLLLNVTEVLAGPAIQHWKTANGARVYFVPAPQLPIVDVRIVFNAGSARDGKKAGLASLTNSLLTSGAGKWDAGQIAEQLESVGAQLGTGSRADMAWLSLRSLTEDKYLKASLSMLTTILSQPTFTSEEVLRIKKQMLISLEDQAQSPSAVAQRAFMAALYEGHPYGNPSGGTAESVNQLDRAVVVDFFKQFYVAKNAIVAIVGAVDRKTAEQMAESVANGLTEGNAAAAVPEVAPLKESKTIHIPFPSSQSSVLIGQPGLKRGDDDYFRLYLGNHSFGGSGFSSILMSEIREKRGLVYSVYSYFAPMSENGPFTIGLQTRNNQVDTALALVHENLNNFISAGPNKKQIQASKRNVTGSAALRTDSNKKIVEYLAVIGFYNLPLDYLDSFNKKIDAVTAQEVADAFKRRISTDKLVTVVVGGEKKQ